MPAFFRRTPDSASPSLVDQLTRSLLLTLTTVWLICIVGVAWFIFSKINHNFDAELRESAQRLMDISEAQSAATPTAPHPMLAAPNPLLASDPLVYQMLDAQGAVVLRSEAAPVAPFPVPLKAGFFNTGPWRVYVAPSPNQPLFLALADPTSERTGVLINAFLTLVTLMVVVLVALALLIRRTARRKLAVLHNLQAQIGLRSGSDLRPIEIEGMPAEPRAVGEDVNRMLQRLSEALDVERSLAANAAHELRTPLATATLRLQAALEGDLNRADVQAALTGLKTLSHRTEKLLQLSRAEAASATNRERVDLAALATAVASEFWHTPSAQLRLDVLEPEPPLTGDAPEPEPVCAQTDPDALAIALRNLIENALRYSDGSKVEVIVRAPATLVVRDYGPGVSAQTLQTLQTRHVRHAHDGAGYGLGMSITTSIIARLEGSLALSSPPPDHAHGFEATITLQPSP